MGLSCSVMLQAEGKPVCLNARGKLGARRRLGKGEATSSKQWRCFGVDEGFVQSSWRDG